MGKVAKSWPPFKFVKHVVLFIENRRTYHAAYSGYFRAVGQQVNAMYRSESNRVAPEPIWQRWHGGELGSIAALG